MRPAQLHCPALNCGDIDLDGQSEHEQWRPGPSSAPLVIAQLQLKRAGELVTVYAQSRAVSVAHVSFEAVEPVTGAAAPLASTTASVVLHESPEVTNAAPLRLHGAPPRHGPTPASHRGECSLERLLRASLAGASPDGAAVAANGSARA